MAGAHFGFIGLGNMGGPMANRLLDAGHQLTVFDVSDKAVEALVARGATKAASPQGVASSAETILMSLPNGDIVNAVATGPNGITSGNKVEQVIDLSTTGPRAAAALAESLAKRNISMIDAPVSGGVAGAKKGTLAVMVSCPRPLYDKFSPVLASIGKTFFVGEKAGMAQTMKLVNNMLSVTALAISSEAMVLGAKHGLDGRTMIEVLNAGSGRNSATVDKIPNHVLPRTFGFGFSLGLSYKDTKLCLDEAEAAGIPMIVGNAVRQLLTVAKARNGADSDMTEIIKCVEDWAGVEVKA